MNISMKTFDNGEIQTAAIRDGAEEYLFENKHQQIRGRKIKELSFTHNSKTFLTMTAFQETIDEHHNGICCPGKLAFRLKGDGIDFQSSIHVKCDRYAEYETRAGNDIRIFSVDLLRLEATKPEGAHTVCQALPDDTAHKLKIFDPVLQRLVESYKRRSREDSDFGELDLFGGTPHQTASIWETLGRAACWAAGGAGTALCCGATALAGCVACGAGFGAAASICADGVGGD